MHVPIIIFVSGQTERRLFALMQRGRVRPQSPQANMQRMKPRRTQRAHLLDAAFWSRLLRARLLRGHVWDPVAEQQKHVEALGSNRGSFTAPDPALLGGAALVHIAALGKKWDDVIAIAEQQPEEATKVYGPGRYAGENLLHMAIIQERVDMVEYLLLGWPELIGDEACGDFFYATPRVFGGGSLAHEGVSATYYGGYPLLFAVSINRRDIVEMILKCDVQGKTVTRPEPPGAAGGCCGGSPATDAGVGLDRYQSLALNNRHGNNALHLCVVHGLPDMYDYCHAAHAHLQDERNDEGLSPLALAAALGHKDMFLHILRKTARPAWDYGPVFAVTVPLDGLERARDPRELTALQCLSRGRHQVTRFLALDASGDIEDSVAAKRLDLLMLPTLQHVLNKKWFYFGVHYFWMKFLTFFVVQVLWTVSALIPHHYATAPENWSEFRGHNVVIAALETAVGALVLWNFLVEVRAVGRKGVRSYVAQSVGAAAWENWGTQLFNVLWLTGYLFRLWRVVMGRERRVDPIEDGFIALAALLGWATLFVYLLPFLSFGPFIVMVGQMVLRDMPRFAVLASFVIMGYTMAMFHVFHMYLGPEYGNPGRGLVSSFLRSLREFFLLGVLGELPKSMDSWDQDRYWQHTRALMWFFTVTGIVLLVIMLLNLLIAMMSHTYDTVAQQSTHQWYAELVNLMTNLEDELSQKRMEFERSHYAFKRDDDKWCMVISNYQRPNDLEGWRNRIPHPLACDWTPSQTPDAHPYDGYAGLFAGSPAAYSGGPATSEPFSPVASPRLQTPLESFSPVASPQLQTPESDLQQSSTTFRGFGSALTLLHRGQSDCD